MEETLLQFFERFGLPMGLVIFFVWQGWAREKDLAGRVAALELFTQNTLLGLVRDAHDVVGANSMMLRRIEHFLNANGSPRTTPDR